MPDELPEECCAKCRFWWDRARDSYGDSDGVFGENTFSSCRRFPKSFIGGNNRLRYDDWEHPVMIDVDWCGEFQPRKETPS